MDITQIYDTSAHNQKNIHIMTKTFTTQETIDITYNYGNSNTSKSLDDFMRLAKLKPFKGSNQPMSAATLITNMGTKTRKPLAALSPMPTHKPSIVSMFYLIALGFLWLK